MREGTNVIYVIEYFSQEAWENDTMLDEKVFNDINKAVQYLYKNGYTEEITGPYLKDRLFQEPIEDDYSPRFFTGARIRVRQIF